MTGEQREKRAIIVTREDLWVGSAAHARRFDLFEAAPPSILDDLARMLKASDDDPYMLDDDECRERIRVWLARAGVYVEDSNA